MVPMADLAIFLQKMQDNQAKHQEQVVHLLHNIFYAPTVPQKQLSSVHSKSAAVSADSTDNIHYSGSSTVNYAAFIQLLLVLTSSGPVHNFCRIFHFCVSKNSLLHSLVWWLHEWKSTSCITFLPGYSWKGKGTALKFHYRRFCWPLTITPDPTVRKGRALAYQTRVDQITQQLRSGSLEIGDDQDSPLESHINSQESGLLELERHEAIGEIIKLNPSYKAPADYKPLLKEAKVPIPIKEYPGYNFIGIIFGSASDTQKRLKKETGAKIRVYGAKNTGKNSEITPSDGNKTLSVYKDLYVHVCADTYEKVDSAVALIELLARLVSVNPVSASTTTVTSGDSVNVIHPSQGQPPPYKPPSAINPGLTQPILGPPPHGQFHSYSTPWFPMGSPSGFPTNQNSSSILSNPVQVSSSPSNASNMPSLFSPRPIMMGPQNPSFIGGTPYNSRPLAAPLPKSAPPLTFLNWPLTSSGWSQPPSGPPVSLGPSNTGLMSRPMVPSPQRPHPMSGGPPLNMVNSPFRPPAPQPSGAPPTRPITAPVFASAPQPQMPTRPHSSTSPMQPIVAWPNSAFGSTQHSPVASAPSPPQSGNPGYALGVAPSFTPVKPPLVSAPVPLHPSSNNFTFQPQRPQNPVSPVMPRLPPQNFPVQQPPMLRTPSFRPAMHNFGFPPAMQGPGPMGPPTTPVPHMGPKNFGPALLPPRPGNLVPPQQNYPAMGSRPSSFLALNQQQFGGNRPSSSSLGTQQIYDPFFPTSVPQQVGGNPAKVGKQESDPEYEDLK
ncbi:hypothetical protein LguiA_036713 [Lonicera macranthoides]